MANLTYRSETDGGDSTLTVNNVNATLPAGTANGDIQSIWCGCAVLAPASPPVIVTPTGWTVQGSSSVLSLAGAVLNARLTLFTKVADGTDGTVNLATNGGTNAAISFIRKSYQNPNTANICAQVSFIGATGGPDTSPVVTGLTTGANNAMIDIYIAQGASQNCTPPGSMTERADNATQGISSADEIITTAGATGTRTFTLPASADYLWGIAEFRSAPGQITVQPTPQRTYEGQTATFSLTASPTGTPSYQWKDDGSNVGTNSNSYTTAVGVAATDNGAQITCVVTDDNGSSTSNAATWTVLHAGKPFYLKA